MEKIYLYFYRVQYFWVPLYILQAGCYCIVRDPSSKQPHSQLCQHSYSELIVLANLKTYLETNLDLDIRVYCTTKFK